ncbi:hypothetical protein FM105_04685 [Brevibacterium yomogidense]|uniref:Uncharacterized protein n=1 Tax=Brevibacterium yomogidense TaxID=946573 RepID=A0A1X6X9X6_9MICO|nr:hypothetical protein FM105_04685 [Brevibacterium yomogidense]
MPQLVPEVPDPYTPADKSLEVQLSLSSARREVRGEGEYIQAASVGIRKQ